ncbi:MAG: hypothetical protein GY938_18690 [Ketobacter sp.]|nr:hypothetical protein [Ketobacter sp.]
MIVNSITGVRIAGAANGWPEDLLGPSARLNNAQIYEFFYGADWREHLAQRQWDEDRPQQEFGLRSRSWLRGSSFTVLDLAIVAAEKALHRAGIKPQDLDCIFVATCTPFQISSTLAGKVARHLNTNAVAIDIRAGGAGGLDSMITAAMYHSHGCKASLIIAAEASSLFVSKEDSANGMLFGDGASAMVFVSDESAHQQGLVGGVLGSAPWQGKPFTVTGRLPPTPDFKAEDYLFQAPDDTYRACLANVWEQTSLKLKDTFPAACADMSVILPYALTRPQVLKVAASFDTKADAALNLLAEHGCIGCVSPLAAIVQYIEEKQAAGESATGNLLGSMAVAGGIAWTGLLWQM